MSSPQAERALYAFTSDLEKFAEHIDLNIATATQMIALKVHDGCVLKTPVDTGRARAGWALSIGEPSDYVPPAPNVPDGTPPGNGSPTDPQFASVPAADVSAIDGSQLVFIVNNVEYIQFLEEGHSQQAPSGMVRLTLQAVEAEVEALLAS